MKNTHLPLRLVGLIGLAGLLLLMTSGIDGFMKGKNISSGNGDGIYNASAHLLKIRSNQVTGTVDLKDVLNAREQVERMSGSSAHRADMLWTELGPDNYAGRVRAILIDHRDATGKTVYAASISGGIWKTVNAGQTWVKINGFEDNPNIVCLAQAANGDIYAGTGEYFVSSQEDIARFNGFIGRGIYHSTDGDNFEVIPTTVPDQMEGTASPWAYVTRIAVDPNSGRIYAATQGGLVYSNDGFATVAFAMTGEGELLDTIATDVDVASDGMVAAVVATHCYISANGDPGSFIDQSTRYYSAPDTLVNENKLPMEDIVRLELVIAPSNPDVLYAMAASSLDPVHELSYGELEGIYASEDGGENWRLVGPGGSDLFDVLGTGNTYLGFYNNTLAVHPTDPYRLLAGGYSMWEGHKVNGTGYYSWSQRSSSLQLAPTYVHSSHHVYVYNPANPSVCYVGSDGGLFISDNGFASFRNINRQFNTCQFYSVGFDHSGFAIGGTQGNGVIFLDHQGNTPETGSRLGWPFITLNAGYQAISMVMPNCFILSGEELNLFRSDDYGQNFSPVFIPGAITNGGVFLTPFALWESFNNQNSRDSVTFVAERNYSIGDTVVVHSNNNDYPFSYITPDAISEGELVTVKDIISARFFLAVRNSVYMTTEVLDFTKEPTFYEISEIQGTPSCIAYSKDANYIFTGTQEGNVYRIANVALAYNEETADIDSDGCIIATTLVASYPGRMVTSISVDPNNPNHVLVTLGNYGNTDYVFRTTDAIDSLPTFESIQGNLPHMPIYSSLIELNSSDRILLGTEYGIWSTQNAGRETEWINENDGMGNVPVFMLKQQVQSQFPISNYGVIYAATHGRGLFKSETFVGYDEPEPPLLTTSPWATLYPNPVRDELQVSFELNRQTAVTIELFDINGRKIRDAMPPAMIPDGKHLLKVDVRSLKQGTYLLLLRDGSKVSASKFVVLR